MKTKSFYDYIKTRLSDEQIAEIERRAQLEVDILRQRKVCEEEQKSSKKDKMAQRRTFQEYLEKRFSKEEISEIKEQALREKEALQALQDEALLLTKRPTFEEFKKRILKDEETRAIYEVLRPEFELMIAFIKARKKAKISQQELDSVDFS